MLFRLRGILFASLIFLGFWAPWERAGHGHPGTVWLLLAGVVARAAGVSISYTIVGVMAAAILLTLLAALLRTWASAYLGAAVVQSFHLHGSSIVAAGPFRFVRNPLYLGLWLHLLALAVIMPPGGALLMLAGTALLIFVLVRIEERYLVQSQGEAYLQYKQCVPRFLWSWRPRIRLSGERPNWLGGVLGELYMWGATITYLGFAGRFNVLVLEQGLLISAGISILARGLRRPGPVSGSAVPLQQ